jgi:hypothetical protein
MYTAIVYTVVLWYYGTMILYTMVQWYCGAVYTMILQYCNTIIQWYKLYYLLPPP